MLIRSFFNLILENMDFGKQWIRWIKWCLSTAKFSIFVNETPSNFSHSSKSLRQGNTLSLYVFMIAMKAFNCLFERVVNGGYLSTCQVRSRGGEELRFLTCCLKMIN